jgi:hypothetical protein
MKPPFRTASLTTPPSLTNRIGVDNDAVPSLSDLNVPLVFGTVALRRPPPVGKDAAECRVCRDVLAEVATPFQTAKVHLVDRLQTCTS